MAKAIIEHVDEMSVNLFFAHNFHVNTKHRATEYHLRRKFGDRYQIVMTAGVSGRIRHDGECSAGVKCKKFSDCVIYDAPKSRPFHDPNVKKYKKDVVLERHRLLTENFPQKLRESGWVYISDNYSDNDIGTPDAVVIFTRVRPLKNIKRR